MAADLIGDVVSTSITLIPDEYSLNNAYPNPFNPVTTISYGLPEESFVRLAVYDVMGREVDRLYNDIKPAGYHALVWNAGNNASGMYFVQLISEDFVKTQKIILVK